MQRAILAAAAIGGLFAVILGAFGAHGLKPLLTAAQLGVWEKGVQYQMYHTFALFLCALYIHQKPSYYIRNASICFAVGIVCFSGSLYLLATNEFNHLPVLILGPATPIGGLFFIGGWVFVLMEALKRN